MIRPSRGVESDDKSRGEVIKDFKRAKNAKLSSNFHINMLTGSNNGTRAREKTDYFLVVDVVVVVAVERSSCGIVVELQFWIRRMKMASEVEIKKNTHGERRKKREGGIKR